MIYFRRKKRTIRKKAYHKLVVAGMDNGVGVTHFSILLANYYSEVLGKKTAIVDLNTDNDYEFLKQICLPESLHQNNVYTIQKVDYYQGIVKTGLADVFQKDYEYVILDVGINYGKFTNEISMCDVKYLISTPVTWKIPGVIAKLKDMQFHEQWKFMYCFGNSESADYISEYIGKRLYHIPFIENPFKITGRQLMEVERILEA